MFTLNTCNFLLKLFNSKLSDSHLRDTSTIKLKLALKGNQFYDEKRINRKVIFSTKNLLKNSF